MAPFEVVSDFQPAGDQPAAIADLTRRVKAGETDTVLLGATGTGKSATTAWLIEQAGIQKGFALPGSRAAVSSKHTLAIVNRGGASASEIAELGRFIQTRVFSEFGVRLQAEPNLIGVQL